MNININNIIKFILPFFIISVFSYALCILFYMFLPKNYEANIQSNEYGIEYNKYKVYNSFKDKTVKKEQKKIVPKKKEYKLISSILLKAIYATSKNSGWIIIEEKKAKKTHILGLNDMFKDFKLTAIYKNYVIFTKNGKEYKLSLKDAKTEPKYSLKNTNEKKVLKINKDVEQKDGSYSVKRSLVDKYIKNPSTIWNNIKIKEVLTNGKIDGFRINGLSNKSIFKKLGLRRGDIIKKVNNITLKSYADAFKLYKKIDKLENLNFQIIRDNQEMEIEYEIK